MKVEEAKKVMVYFDKEDVETLKNFSEYMKEFLIKTNVSSFDTIKFMGSEWEDACIMEGRKFSAVVWDFLDLVDNFMIP